MPSVLCRSDFGRHSLAQSNSHRQSALDHRRTGRLLPTRISCWYKGRNAATVTALGRDSDNAGSSSVRRRNPAVHKRLTRKRPGAVRRCLRSSATLPVDTDCRAITLVHTRRIGGSETPGGDLNHGSPLTSLPQRTPPGTPDSASKGSSSQGLHSPAFPERNVPAAFQGCSSVAVWKHQRPQATKPLDALENRNLRHC